MLFYSYKKLNALHAPAYISKYVRKTIKDKKAFFRASLNGSMTLEASITLPLFLLFCCSIIYIIHILTLQQSLQNALEESSRKVSRQIYLSDSIKNLSALEKIKLNSKHSDLFLKVTEKVMIQTLFKEAFLSKEVENAINKSYIINGCDGINFNNTFLTSNKEEVSFVISYSIKVPFLPSLIKLDFTQSISFHSFIGISLLKDKASSISYVYITVNGAVYHNNPFCSYLLSYAGFYSKDYLENIIKDKESFHPCPNCAKKTNMPDKVLLCINSNVYHTRIDCFYISKTISKIPFDTVKDKTLCSRCEKGLDK